MDILMLLMKLCRSIFTRLELDVRKNLDRMVFSFSFGSDSPPSIHAV